MTNFLILSFLSLMIMFAVFGAIGVATALAPRVGKALTWPLLIGVLIGAGRSGQIFPALTGFSIAFLLLGAIVVKKRKKAVENG